MSSQTNALAAARTILEGRQATAPSYLVPTAGERALEPVDAQQLVQSGPAWQVAARLYLLLAEYALKPSETSGIRWRRRFNHSMVQHLSVSATDPSISSEQQAGLLAASYDLQNVFDAAGAVGTKRRLEKLPVDWKDFNWLGTLGISQQRFAKAVDTLRSFRELESWRQPARQPADPRRDYPSAGPNRRAAPDVVRQLVDSARSADLAAADPDDPHVRGFAEFGLPADSPLATKDQLRDLEAWRDSLQIPPNSAFVDGTLLLTVEALLGDTGRWVLTPATLWELTAFIDAVACFDRLYCLANPVIDASRFNQRLGANVLTAIPDPNGGMLRRLAAYAAASAMSDMKSLRQHPQTTDAWGQEVQAVVDAWRAVLGPDIPSDGPFDIQGIDVRLAEMAAPAVAAGTGRTSSTPYNSLDLSAALVDGPAASSESTVNARHKHLQTLIEATYVPATPADPGTRPSLQARQQFAAFATYRTYVNQAIANALAMPYMPGTLRMPFRRLFVQRAAEIQDELVTVALADQALARMQPSSPLTLPFFTAPVLHQAASREDVWTQLAQLRERSVRFRRVRADWDQKLEQSLVSAEARQIQASIRNEALKLADWAGAAQESASVALGVVAQTGIVPLAGVLKVCADAATGADRSDSWRRIWRWLFHRNEYFLTQTNSQAIALTNALPQIEKLWEMPKVGGYQKQFASNARQIGRLLRD
jgi:hypothetical protein